MPITSSAVCPRASDQGRLGPPVDACEGLQKQGPIGASGWAAVLRPLLCPCSQVRVLGAAGPKAGPARAVFRCSKTADRQDRRPDRPSSQPNAVLRPTRGQMGDCSFVTQARSRSSLDLSRPWIPLCSLQTGSVSRPTLRHTARQSNCPRLVRAGAATSDL